LIAGVLQYHGINNACAVQKQVDKQISDLTRAIFKKASDQRFSQRNSILEPQNRYGVKVKITFDPPPSTLIRRAALQLSM